MTTGFPPRSLLIAGCLALVPSCLALDDTTTSEYAGELDKTSPEPIRKPTMLGCDRDFVVSDGPKSRALMYCATADVQAAGSAPALPYRGYKRLIITQHGRGGDARMYFDTTHELDQEYATPSFIIAPQFLSMSEVLDDYSGVINFQSGYHFEWGGSWPLGSLSSKVGVGDFTRSSYDLLDQLVATAVARLPDLEEVVIVGQSAGGQLVNRYAAANQLAFPASVNVRYIPMNPQSWLYLDGTRPFPELAVENGGFLDPNAEPADIDLPAVCPEYNRYHTGLEDLTMSYFVTKGIVPATIISQFKKRRVINMVGELDTEDPEGGSFNCRYRVQGLNRNERAHAYHAHVVGFYAPLAVNHFLFEIPGVSHGHKNMYKSPCGRRWIFDDLNAVCL